tara:strand:+ start:955 stop:1248 length:294 start_codon:yes stop_codon:yes gene_type:complete
MVYYKHSIVNEQHEMSKIGQYILEKQERENNEYHNSGRYSIANRQPLWEGAKASQGREESNRAYEDWVEFCDRSNRKNSQAQNRGVEGVDNQSAGSH